VRRTDGFEVQYDERVYMRTDLPEPEGECILPHELLDATRTKPDTNTT
jgi:hypothetical protein